MSSLPSEPPLQQVMDELFRDHKGDEMGGQHAIRGFSFQVWLAVLEALRAHAKPDDYAVVLEWQQDIAVLNSSSQPSALRFVQIKKNESTLNWTFARLIAPDGSTEEAVNDSSPVQVAEPALGDSKPASRKSKGTKKPKPSILAKLYKHRRRFKGLAQSKLQFTSNAPFEVPDEAGGSVKLHHVELHELPPQARGDIERRLREQLELPLGEQIDLSDFELLVTDCSLSEPHKTVAGEFLEMQMTSDFQMSARGAMMGVLIVASYVNLRAGKGRFARTLPELLQRGVTRQQVGMWLSAANDRAVPTSDHVQAVIDRLNAELADQHLVREMRRQTTRACVQISDRTSATPMLAARLKALYEANDSYSQIPLLKDMFARWYDDIKAQAPPEFGLYRREYLYCLMAMIHEDANPIQQLPSPPAGAQPKDGQ